MAFDRASSGCLAAAWRLSQYAAGRDTYPSWDAGLAYKVSVQLGDAAEDV